MKNGNDKTVALPQVVPQAFLDLIKNADGKSAEALKMQVFFSDKENFCEAFENADPLGEANYMATPFCVHQHENRVLVLTTGRCLGYCRYCFRREFTARARGFLSEEELDEVLDYVTKHPEVTEILLSGGDPLSASFETLEKTLLRIRDRSKNLLIRICTRANIFAPSLFTEKLIRLLRKCKPLWLIPHINHPAELGKAQVYSIEACLDAGVPMQSQSVLLRGVNDEAEILAQLFTKLVQLGVKPGYLFQLDTARGTSHFAVPLEEALSLWRKLSDMLSGLSRPEFAVDLQNGGGKFSLSALALHDQIIEVRDTGFKVRKSDGRIFGYKI